MKYTLGLDLGQSSIGWAVLENDNNQTPMSLVDWGSHIFPDGRDAQSDEPLAVERRMKRSARRRRDRFQARMRELMRVMIASGMMPKSRQEQKALQTLNPYALRAKAVEEEIPLHQLGRAIYHIAQRRGFKSNRKADRGKADNDASGMKVGIGTLQELLKDKTLGQLLYERQQNGEWLRFRPTGQKAQKKQWDLGYPDRSMYEAELDKMWAVQKSFHAELTVELYQKIHKIIILQRSLKKPKVGRCEFEHQCEGSEGERAPLALPIVQRFRIWQEVNNLEVDRFDALNTGLSFEKRKEIVSHLRCNQTGKSYLKKNEDLTFANIRKKILKMDTDCAFNLESNRDFLKADIVSGQLSDEACFGEKWFELDDDRQTEIVLKIMDVEHEDELVQWLMYDAQLSEGQATNAARISMPDGYGRLSLKAIKKLLPHLEEGMKYHKACIAAGYHHSQHNAGDLRDSLPYYGEIMPDSVIGEDKQNGDPVKSPDIYYGKITNTTVHIGLNQLRKLINAIIAKYGKPERIVIELARELKMTQEQKRKYNARIKENTKENARIDAELEKHNVSQSRLNRQKYKLWEELAEAPNERCCPFTGKTISAEDLLSERVEIEHLLPFSITYDDSMANKVVCFQEANRYKGNRTPYEAFGDSPDGYKWESILARATNMPKNKSWRFKEDAREQYLKEGDGIARLLNDTKYLSRVAQRYLKCICKDVYPVTGQMTAMLRRSWGINNLLGEAEKNRGDHRHHALDAFVIGCISRRTMQTISHVSGKARDRGEFKDIFRDWPPPWEGYAPEKLKEPLSRMVVSHKIDHGHAGKAAIKGKTIGQLHQETNYGLIHDDGKGNLILSSRVELKGKGSSNDSGIARKKKNIEEIATDWIRNDLLKVYESLSDKEWKEHVANYASKHNVRHVRIHIKKSADTVRKITHRDSEGKEYYRYVATGGNYCAEIYEPTFDKKGKWLPKEKRQWQAEFITLYDVHRKGFTPVWKQEHPTAKKIMRLHINDMIALDTQEGVKLFRINDIPQSGQFGIREHTVAKNSDKYLAREKSGGVSIVPKVSTFQQHNARKVSVDIMGRVKMP